MPYVLVTADFPNITTEERRKIYSCLTGKSWVKIHELERDIDTVWQGFFTDTISESNAIKSTIDDFVECSKPYCKPKLIVHWGLNRPTRYGLV